MQELPPGFRIVGAQPQGDPVIAPPDPYRVADEQREQEDQERQRRAEEREQIRFEERNNPDATGGKKSATELELDAKAEGMRRRAATIRAAIAEVRGLYETDIKGQPLSRLFGATEYLDALPKNDRFRAAGSTILPLIRPLVAQTAREGDSDKEMQVFMAYVPSNDDSDIAIEQKFKMLDALISGMAEGKSPSVTLRDIAATGAEEVSLALREGRSREELLRIAEERGLTIDEAALDANLASRRAGGPVNQATPADIEAIMAKYGIER